MASTIGVPDIHAVGGYPFGISQSLVTVASAAKTDIEALQAKVQSGTSTLTAGVSAAITATITASSRISVTRKTVGGSAIGTLAAPSGDRVVGASGSFKVRSYKADATAETADTSTFDWVVVN